MEILLNGKLSRVCLVIGEMWHKQLFEKEPSQLVFETSNKWGEDRVPNANPTNQMVL